MVSKLFSWLTLGGTRKETRCKRDGVSENLRKQEEMDTRFENMWDWIVEKKISDYVLLKDTPFLLVNLRGRYSADPHFYYYEDDPREDDIVVHRLPDEFLPNSPDDVKSPGAWIDCIRGVELISQQIDEFADACLSVSTIVDLSEDDLSIVFVDSRPLLVVRRYKDRSWIGSGWAGPVVVLNPADKRQCIGIVPEPDSVTLASAYIGGMVEFIDSIRLMDDAHWTTEVLYKQAAKLLKTINDFNIHTNLADKRTLKTMSDKFKEVEESL